MSIRAVMNIGWAATGGMGRTTGFPISWTTYALKVTSDEKSRVQSALPIL